MTETNGTEQTEQTKERYVILSNPNQTAVIDTFTNAALFTYTGPNRLINALDRHMRLTERWEALQGGASLAEEADAADGTPAEPFTVMTETPVTTPAEDMTVTQPLPDFTLTVIPPIRSAARSLLPGRLNGAPHAAGASVKNLGPFDPREYGLPAAPRSDRVTRLTAMLGQVIESEDRLWKLLAEDSRELNRAVSLRKRLERDIRAAGNVLSATERAERSPLVPPATTGTFEVGEPVLWASWNGPRPGRIVRRSEHEADTYFVEVDAKRTHPCMGSFRGWIPAAELHHVVEP